MLKDVFEKTRSNPWKIGDDVIICGKVYLYNGKTPETVSNKAFK